MLEYLSIKHLIRVSNFKMEEGEKINQDEIEELTNEINEQWWNNSNIE